MLISFIVPTFNSEKTLGKCLKSIKNQKIKKEIIVVDSGSEDNTQAIAKNNGVRLIIDTKRGIARARNMGIESSGGDYIAFVDSDVVLPKNWVVIALKLIDENHNIAAVGGPGISKNKSIVSRSIDNLLFGKGVNIKKEFVNSLATMNVLYKKDAIRNMRFDEDMFAGEDPEFNFRLLKRGFVLLYNRKLWVYHHHPTKIGGMIRKWYNYGKSYPLLGSKHKELRTPIFWARILYLPTFIAMFIIGTILNITLYIATIQMALIFFYYFYKGLILCKGFLIIAFPFVHTVKQIAHMVGHIMGLKYLL